MTETREETKTIAPSLDYTNLSKNLSVFESFSEEPTLFNTLMGRRSLKKSSTSKEVALVEDLNNNPGENEFRYQNITTENLGYTGKSVDVRPYGIAK
jgi:hypothetical protein